MSLGDRIRGIICDSLAGMSLNDPDPPGPDTTLLGKNSFLDSLAFVSLLVAVEDRMSADLGLEVTIADEEALDLEPTPFATVGSLARYISDKVESNRRSP